MKKYLALLALACAMSAQAKDLTRNEWTGKWLCASTYPSIHTQTLDAAEYFADGTGKVYSIIDSQVTDSQLPLRYAVVSSLRWKLDGNQLTQVQHTDTVKRAHSPQMQAALQKIPELAKLEQNFFEILKHDGTTDKDNEVVLLLTRESNDKFTVHQQNIDDMRGICRRVPEKMNE